MNDTEHLLEIYDADDYDGPNPLRLRGCFIVHGPENARYFITKPTEPMKYNGYPIEQLALRMRYDGDNIENALTGTCTVLVNLAPEDCTYEEGSCYGFDDFRFWHAGRLSRLNH
jgi:hypothetical protein